ncbi:hypothetical protein EUGRSUZ_F01784 [Eucalyptus grandis]|uniref:Uncharacterized protein n=2 Tax=Eucalyptus grandis TaxID=71139 RepID=A0ACC3KFC0_EUCGR|nr:hypothetical protein EUGRSUZ_F01784 [Eucalyptus grandis]
MQMATSFTVLNDSFVQFEIKGNCFCRQLMLNQMIRQRAEIECPEEKNTKRKPLYGNRRLELCHVHIEIWVHFCYTCIYSLLGIKPVYFRTHLHWLNIHGFRFSVLLQRFRGGTEHDMPSNRCFAYSSVEFELTNLFSKVIIICLASKKHQIHTISHDSLLG